MAKMVKDYKSIRRNILISTLFSIILIFIVGCKDQESEIITRSVQQIIETEDQKKISDEKSITALLKELPDLTAIDVEDDQGNYFGTFYLNENGITDAEYASSAAIIEVLYTELEDELMTVYFLFQFLGSEQERKDEPQRYFKFLITQQKIARLLAESPDTLIFTTKGTEINEADVPHIVN